MVDFGDFFRKLDRVDYDQVQPVDELPAKEGIRPSHIPVEPGTMRLVDCLECGLCVSACPAAATDERYLGPASLASAQLKNNQGGISVQDVVNDENGLWRCHSAYECTEVCPSFVEPASRIMDLRRRTVSMQIKHIFGGK